MSLNIAYQTRSGIFIHDFFTLKRKSTKYVHRQINYLQEIFQNGRQSRFPFLWTTLYNADMDLCIWIFFVQYGILTFKTPLFYCKMLLHVFHVGLNVGLHVYMLCKYDYIIKEN